MLQGLRRKIGRYAPRAGGAKEPEEEEQVQLKENATPFETAAWHFSRQDRVLRRLETETTLMIDQIQVACATMATAADIFCSGGDEAVSGCIGGEYKSAMKQIEREEAERMEQSIRFTVLDPLQARLELHGQIREDINARDKLEVESKMLRGVTLRMQSSGLEDDDRRAQTELDLHRVAAALQQAEAQLLPQLEDTIQSGAASIVALFNATRLQTAIFFLASEDGANSLAKNGEQLHIIPQSATEWLAIEECLWEIDLREAKSPGKSLLTADSISSTADVLLSGLLQKHDALYFECLSYLRVEDLARLSKVNFRLRSHLLDSAPIWKKCIRSGGLSPAIRSSLWLSVFYESTPWRSSGIASHYLSPDRRHSMYDQLLTKVEVKLADGLIAEGLPLSDDDSQLAVWFREIDVDVVRTCHRSIHDGNVETVSSLSPPISKTEMSNDEDSVESVMMELIDCIVRNEGSESSFDSTENSELEAKVRRVLRAYVLYNPRVGYCQGMGFLVRLLAEVANDEADIFWLFVGFSEPENDRNLYEPGMAVLQPYLSKFELLFSTHMPELYTHLQAEGVHVATFCTRWFLTFFSSFETLAPTLVTRLLDIFVIDGWRIMFSVSLVILDELKEQLLQSDMEGILRVLQFPRRYMPEPDQLRKRQLVRHALAFSISRAINSI
ncbi:hypothetical protein PRNP1_013655 [Phytophthora ramorum]